LKNHAGALINHAVAWTNHAKLVLSLLKGLKGSFFFYLHSFFDKLKATNFLFSCNWMKWMMAFPILRFIFAKKKVAHPLASLRIIPYICIAA
jgi:hypothetical protein